jgi:hypothetical protein
MSYHWTSIIGLIISFLPLSLVNAHEIDKLLIKQKSDSVLISQNTSWNRNATIEVEVVGGKPSALVKEGYWDVYYNSINEQNPDLAICIQDEFGKNDCIPGHVNKPQNIFHARCQDTYNCNFPNVALPSGKFKVVIVDVDVAANDLIGYDACDINMECQVGQATIKISAISENIIGNQHKVPELPSGLTEAKVNQQARANGFPKAQYPHFSSPNGCGPADSFTWHLIPNDPSGYDFTEACNHHDICYMANLDRNSCDETFLKETRHLCYEVYKKVSSLSLCHKSAGVYYSKVRDNGQQPFENAQQKQTKYLIWLRQYIENWQKPSSSASSNSSNDPNFIQTSPNRENNSNEPLREPIWGKPEGNSNQPLKEPLWGEPETVPETNESSPPGEPIF